MVKIQPVKSDMLCVCGGKLIKKGTLNSGNSIYTVYRCNSCNKEKMVADRVL